MTYKPLLIAGLSLCVMSARPLVQTAEVNATYQPHDTEVQMASGTYGYLCYMFPWTCAKEKPKPAPKPKPKLA